MQESLTGAAMAGYTLPTELLQEILLSLDIESFHSASLTCKSWRAAALSTHLLRRQLKAVPTLSNNNIETATLPALQSLFRRICTTHLIGLQHTITFTSTALTPDPDPDPTFPRNNIPLRTQDGYYPAHLRGLTLTFNTPTSGRHEIQLVSAIFPNADAVRQILGYNHSVASTFSRPFARMQAALSACGGVLAVALGRNVQIYFLRDGAEMGSVAGVIGESGLEAVRGVEFEGVGGLLRVEIDGPGGAFVRYVGFGGCDCQGESMSTSTSGRDSRSIEQAQLAYWEKALQNVYLDSRTIERSLGDGTSLRGMRVVNTAPAHQLPEDKGKICPCQTERTFFALFRRARCSFYAVGRVSHDGRIEITQRLPARRPSLGLKSPQETKPAEPEAGGSDPGTRLDRFDARNLPTAHSFDPLLSVSEDGKMLVVSEPPHGGTKGGVYVCRCLSLGEEGSEPWPFALSMLDEPLMSLRVSWDEGGGEYVVDAQSERRSMQWELRLRSSCFGA
ncbi:F-box protein [Aspergillus mulundensis]|uniref:F-box domain-containing protein n=1 Tax=Aspergillus mulundensis TaxID=1810919 RepID=A0A3D8QJC9_9EURO|nr:hypothetical protein DSM5745_10490 [Aspergillus mulundensis]RDW61818.1 hypothetical protein DSM5745_10490 [Aspergillus mulundensis]